MKYLTSGPSGVLSISYHGLCIFTKLKISWQVLLGMLKKSQESHLSTKIGSHLFFEDVLVDWVSSFFSFSTLGKRHFVCFCGSNSRWKYALAMPTEHMQLSNPCFTHIQGTPLSFSIYLTMLFSRILLHYLVIKMLKKLVK